jgi:hypothetical protein
MGFDVVNMVTDGAKAIGDGVAAVGDMVKQDVRDILDVGYHGIKSGYNPFIPTAAKDHIAKASADAADKVFAPVDISVNRDRKGLDLAKAYGNSILTVGSIVPGVAAAKAGIKGAASLVRGVSPGIKAVTKTAKIPGAAKEAVRSFFTPKNWTKPMLQKAPILDKNGNFIMHGLMGNRQPYMKIAGVIPPRNKAWNKAMSRLDDKILGASDAWKLLGASVSKQELKNAAKFAADSAKQGVKSGIEFVRDVRDDYKRRRKS